MGLIAYLYKWQYRTRQWYAGRMRALWQEASDGTVTEDAPRRVLLVLTGLIGDAVMSTPVIVEARRLWPEAWITLLGNRQTCELLSTCPLVDACVETPVIPFALRKRRKVGELKRWLREQDFDVAIILLGDQFAQVLAEAEIPIRVGVRGHLLSPFLTTTYDVGSPKDWGPPERLGALRALSYHVRNVRPNLWISDHARPEARRRLAELGLPEGIPYSVVHPFGSTRSQWWPLDRMAELVDSLSRGLDLRTVMVGGPETRGALGPLCGNVIDTTGELTIPELMAVIESARLVISTDSGPFHIAGALGRPLVGLFRGRRPEHAGRYPQARVVLGQHSSCTRHCEWNRCQAIPCRQMNELTVGDVLRVIQHLPTLSVVLNQD
jgi:ADP-heptose:LPS heptosyltransferase